MSGDIWERGADVTTLPYPSLGGTDVVQISMNDCQTKGRGSALESLSIIELVSIKRSGVGGYLGGGS